MMWLVDTSVWLDFLRGKGTAEVERLKFLLSHNERLAIASIIYQEILQGVKSEKVFKKYQTYFGSQPFVHPRNPKQSYADAAKIFFLCRKKGITIRSTIDCLIAQIAIEHDLYLLHADRDFIHMAEVIPGLKLAENAWR